MDQGTEPVGELSDIHQEDDYNVIPIASVPVCLDGPVQTHLLPKVSGSARRYRLVVGDPPVRIANRDLRRARLTILGVDSLELGNFETFTVANTQNEADTGYGVLWRTGVTLEITHCEEVWVKSGAATIISVITENWAS